MLSLIVAMDKHRGIGYNNALPWYLPKDLKYFQETTTGHIVIMGRKTYESIGKPLKNRMNVVMSSTMEETDEIVVSADPRKVVEVAKEFYDEHGLEAFVIGGGQIFEYFMQIADKIYVTKIDAVFPSDTKFPFIHDDEWREISKKKDNDRGYDLEFLIYERIEKK